jgi:hypothetical protein
LPERASRIGPYGYYRHCNNMALGRSLGQIVLSSRNLTRYMMTRVRSFIKLPPQPRRSKYRCYPETIQDHYTIRFPKNVRITRIPPTVSFAEGHLRYHANYQLRDGALFIKRRFENRTPSIHCQSADYAVLRRFHKVLQRDMRGQVFYE